MTKFLYLTGVQSGRLTVLRRNRTMDKLVCACSCGKKIEVSVGNFRSRHTQSCGCLSAERTSADNAVRGIHFESGMRTPEYEAWRNMRRRCYDSTSQNYRYYGGRGITVCERWMESYLFFLADVFSQSPYTYWHILRQACFPEIS